MTEVEYKTKMRRRALVLVPIWVCSLFGVFIPWAYFSWYVAIPLTILAILGLSVSGAIMKGMANKYDKLKEKQDD